MASLKEWTTAAIVSQHIMAGTSLTTAQIEEVISQCESVAAIVLKIPSTFTFSATNIYHMALRQLVTIMAARLIIASNMQSFNTLDQAGLALDLYEQQFQDLFRYLQSPANRDYMVSGGA